MRCLKPIYLFCSLLCLSAVLSGCGFITKKPSTEWQEFTGRVRQMNADEVTALINRLNNKLSTLLAAVPSAPNSTALLPVNKNSQTSFTAKNTLTDKTRMQLAYLLSRKTHPRPNLDLDLAELLLSEILEKSEYAYLASELMDDIEQLKQVHLSQNFSRWLLSLNHIETNLIDKEIVGLEEQLQCCHTEKGLIKLAYLLSHKNTETATRNLERIAPKLELLAEYKGLEAEKNTYALFSKMLLKQIQMNQQLMEQKVPLTELQNQLDALKNIDDLMDESQRNLDSALPTQQEVAPTEQETERQEQGVLFNTKAPLLNTNESYEALKQ